MGIFLQHIKGVNKPIIEWNLSRIYCHFKAAQLSQAVYQKVNGEAQMHPMVRFLWWLVCNLISSVSVQGLPRYMSLV